MVRTLKILVLVSICASLLTLVSARLGMGEIYPFSSWKLFTQPIGSTDLVVQKNIYGQSSKGMWQLLPLRPSQDFDYDDTYYLFNELCQRVEEDRSGLDKKLLRQFAKAMYPSYDTFELRAKYFKVSAIVKDSSMYTEKLVCKF